ncbi:hypothetical protein IT396_01260 [Candidatus Nomurabacteria bacterium]|nr:hypothetical protein [Candidatus Nomurabacteria bacterium]
MEDVYDTEMEELKELVKRQAVQMDDMQKTLHGIRNAQRRHIIYKIAWWLLVTGVAAFAYYTYLWPMLQPIIGVYGDLQGYQEQMADFFSSFRKEQ